MLSPKLRSILSRIPLLNSYQNSLPSWAISFAPGFAASVVITLIVWIVQQLGSLQPLELRIFDLLVRLQPPQKLDSRLLIVTITEADLKKQGWPLSDQVLAETLIQLQQHQPQVIGIDIYRDLAQPPGTEQLIQQLQAENIVAITNLGTPRIPPPPNIPPERIGFNDIPVDPDGVIRRQLLFASTEEETLLSLSLKLALFYLNNKGIEPRSYERNPNHMQLGNGVFIPLKFWQGGYTNIDDLGYQILLNYRQEQIAETLSIGEVLAAEFDPSLVRDRIVLIGATAPSLKDAFLTPYSAAAFNDVMMPGVFIHAHMVSHLLSVALNNLGINEPYQFWQSPRLFWFLPRGVEPIWIWGWALIGGMVTWLIRHPVKQGIAVSLALISLFGIGYGLFIFKGWLPLIAPGLAFVLSSVSVIAYKQVYYLSHDSLTSLPNRTTFVHHIEGVMTRNKRRNKLCGILFLNIDRFKIINESLGHQAGDQLLLDLVKRLKICVRTSDIIARLSGDEFAILIENMRASQNAIWVAERIQQALISPFHLQGQDVFRTVSIGIALNESTGISAEDLLRNANTAMYQARSQTTGSYQVFESKMNVDGKQHLQLETELRRAVQYQEFVLHYQPLISLKTGKIIGLEALIRWQHPQKDLLFPNEFMSIAKETGLIIPMGQWAIQEACHQLKRFQDRFHDLELVMGVNLSSRQFSQPDLVEQIQESILESGVNPQNLRLEISESVVMQEVEETIALLQQLKALNLRLSIDDFGTGFSSLSSLNRFPIDTLKIDRSFVALMETEGEGENIGIVQTIITLAHVLKLGVIAEGVETAQQVKQLRILGCELAQGYYFLRPVPAEQVIEFIESDPYW